MTDPLTKHYATHKIMIDNYFTYRLNMIELNIILSGQTMTIYSVIKDGADMTEEYVMSLTDAEQKKIAFAYQYIAEHGPHRNTEKFRNLDDCGIFELKGSYSRIFCFFKDDNINSGIMVLTHGVDKPKANILRRNISKACDIKNEAIEAGLIDSVGEDKK